jgi:hypothetical protein
VLFSIFSFILNLIIGLAFLAATIAKSDMLGATISFLFLVLAAAVMGYQYMLYDVLSSQKNGSKKDDN